MQPEGSLLYSKQPTNCPRPYPILSTSSHSILFLKRCILILFFHLRLGLPSGLSPYTTTPYAPPLSVRATRPAQLLLDLINPHNILWREQILKILTTQSTPLPCHLDTLTPKHIPHPFSHTLNLCSTLHVRGQVSHPCKTTGKIIPCVSQFLNFWKARRKTKYSAPKDSNHYLTWTCSQFLHKLDFMLRLLAKILKFSIHSNDLLPVFMLRFCPALSIAFSYMTKRFCFPCLFPSKLSACCETMLRPSIQGNTIW